LYRKKHLFIVKHPILIGRDEAIRFIPRPLDLYDAV